MQNRRPGDWDCASCQQMNFASRTKCYKCGAQKSDDGEQVVGVAVDQPIQYTMPRGQYPTYNAQQGGYGYYNNNNNNYNNKKNHNAKPGDWFCTCGVHNYAFRNDCFKCQKSKTEGEVAKPANYGQPIQKPGDWTCKAENCSFLNFANRDKCYKCGSQKPAQAAFK